MAKLFLILIRRIYGYVAILYNFQNKLYTTPSQSNFNDLRTQYYVTHADASMLEMTVLLNMSHKNGTELFSSQSLRIYQHYDFCFKTIILHMQANL